MDRYLIHQLIVYMKCCEYKKYYVQLYLLHFVFFFPPGLFVFWDFWSGQTPNHLAF